MDAKTTTCTRGKNGTYTCTRPEGHSGRHERKAKVTNGANVVVAIRVYSWYDNYGSVRIVDSAPRTR